MAFLHLVAHVYFSVCVSARIVRSADRTCDLDIAKIAVFPRRESAAPCRRRRNRSCRKLIAHLHSGLRGHRLLLLSRQLRRFEVTRRTSLLRLYENTAFTKAALSQQCPAAAHHSLAPETFCHSLVVLRLIRYRSVRTRLRLRAHFHFAPSSADSSLISQKVSAPCRSLLGAWHCWLHQLAALSHCVFSYGLRRDVLLSLLNINTSR